MFFRLNPISSTRNTDYTIQNALFGAMKITKNTDYSKNNYTGYGLCFDEGNAFGHTIREGNFRHTTNARNVFIFGADMSSSVHATNRAKHIYVMGKGFVPGINDTTIYAEKNFYRYFTDLGKKFVLSLHYNGDNSYLFVNGRQELKFKAKNDQIIDEKLCLGNLSSEWTTSESEKTGLYGDTYDFVVDYKSINGVKPIYDMRRYLITKHNISPYIYKMLLINLAISLFSILKVKTLECVSVINEKCISRPEIIDFNKNEPVFYSLSIKVNKCSGDCNNINDPMAKLCVPNIVKDMNIKVFNLLARINETRKIVWHETC